METASTQDDLLELIPWERVTLRQKQFQVVKKRNPLYRLTREPASLEDFDWKKRLRAVAIWRENGTLIWIRNDDEDFETFETKSLTHNPDKHIRLSFLYLKTTTSVSALIFGENDAAIAETFTFLCSLKHVTSGRVANLDPKLSINSMLHFKIAALQPEQLARVLDSNPNRFLEIRAGFWTADQSVVLATRPYSLKLWMQFYFQVSKQVGFLDGGAAFVDALQKRKFRFGALYLEFYSCDLPYCLVFSNSNLKRLLELEDKIELLSIRDINDDIALLPLSAKVESLYYSFGAARLQIRDLCSVDIMPRKLHLELRLEDTEEWHALPIAFLDRVAVSGRLERLVLTMHSYRKRKYKDESLIAKALSRVIRANQQLEHLQVKSNVNWTRHVKGIFEAMENHPKLRTFAANIIAGKTLNYTCLERLLSRNRNVSVFDEEGHRRITNGTTIDALYSFNRFFHGSAAVVKESPSFRPRLITVTLTESALGDFRRTALLLSDHADALCELLDCSGAVSAVAAKHATEEVAHALSLSESCQTETLKRKAVTPLSPAATKAGRIRPKVCNFFRYQ
jgi:hypothetical protein